MPKRSATEQGAHVAPPPGGFAPVASGAARLLILGSFPGVRSLNEQQYYAHPRNAFWPIMAELLDFRPTVPYQERLAELRRRRIALWDVVGTCLRRGSLDAAIIPDSIQVNDFLRFFSDHPSIQTVCFNGRRAEKEFRRAVQPVLGQRFSHLDLIGLPSTSPALATLTYRQKADAWRVILDLVAPDTSG